MKCLDCHTKELKSNGGFYTAKEICAQPNLWDRTYWKLLKEKNQITRFLERAWANEPQVILTGAGSSAFIGEVLAGAFQKKWGVSCRAIATTDIITHPQHYFIKTRPTLLISFARSGDSPESMATIKLAKAHCDNLYQLNITCNKDGELAKKTTDENSYVFLLPEGANDRSLAMTSSFSSMLLSGLLILNIKKMAHMQPIVDKVINFGNYIFDECLPGLRKIAESQYERVVFLGSGPQLGLAHEAHLKVQELSNGKVICTFDSFLGFRHGPKVVVNDATVVVYFFSNNALTRRYELDLVKSVSAIAAGNKSIAIGNGYNDKEYQFDLSIPFPGGTNDIPEDFLSIFYILPAQIMGFYKSLSLGLSPDSPSKCGSITRVVQGVTIYYPVAQTNLNADNRYVYSQIFNKR